MNTSIHKMNYTVGLVPLCYPFNVKIQIETMFYDVLSCSVVFCCVMLCSVMFSYPVPVSYYEYSREYIAQS